MADVFRTLSLIPHDVPQNGDCFYLTIQLFLTHHYDPPILTSVPYLRTSISTLLTTTSVGQSILDDYHETTDILAHTLPSLRPATYPRRDVYAQDYAIAAMATFLNTQIEIYTSLPDSTPILHTFSPYPSYDPTFILPHSPPPISLWLNQTHFQLLLRDNLSLPSLTSNLIPLPSIPLRDINSNSQHILIKAPTTTTYYPLCPYQQAPPTMLPKAFCSTTCHPYCPNHYTAFKTIPHQRFPPNYATSCLLATAGVSANTRLFELA